MKTRMFTYRQVAVCFVGLVTVLVAIFVAVREALLVFDVTV